MILVEMFVVIITWFIAFSDKLFAGKQVNRCQVVFIDSIVPAKGVDFFFPGTVIVYIILEGDSIKPARRIVRRIQRDFEDFVGCCCPILAGYCYCLSGIHHVFVYEDTLTVTRESEETHGAIFAICT